MDERIKFALETVVHLVDGELVVDEALRIHGPRGWVEFQVRAGGQPQPWADALRRAHFTEDAIDEARQALSQLRAALKEREGAE